MGFRYSRIEQSASESGEERWDHFRSVMRLGFGAMLIDKRAINTIKKRWIKNSTALYVLHDSNMKFELPTFHFIHHYHVFLVAT